MKKLSLTLAAVAAIGVSTASAQFYVKAGIGYSIGIGGNAEYNTTQNSSTYAPLSYANGVTPILGLGYMFNPNIGFELGAAYLIGMDQERTIDAGALGKEVRTSKASGITLYPAIKLRAPLNDRIAMYSRSGLALPVSGKITTMRDVTTALGTSNATLETKGNLSLGLHGALGLDVGINDMMSFWAEVNGQALKVSAKSREVTAYMVNGSDQLGSLPAINKTVNFHKELTASMNTTDPNKPGDEVTENASFNAVGIAIGVSFTF